MPKHIVIVGGGLVGSMAAVFFAKRGETVSVYELRKDLRTAPEQRGRSINLALSCRGLAALEAIGLKEKVEKMLVPMRGRMLHSHDGKREPVPYGDFGESINSVDRSLLNQLLLDEAEKHKNVTLHFRHKVLDVNVETGEATFENEVSKKTVTVRGDLIVGADGAYSSVRKELMRRTRMNFSQEYIAHGYLELNIPPAANGDFAMEPNYLHIWPRHTFMMIALPNTDASFTTTLFMPFEKFETIKTEKDVLEFFSQEFPDSIPLLGEKNLVDLFFGNPIGSLVSVKCTPYHHKDKVVLIGDASHAMVPFYGQGMNCGFEDCLILDAILYGEKLDFGLPLWDQHSQALAHRPKLDWKQALEEYSKLRHPDVTSMCDLAMYNYIEMRSAVLSWSYRLRKKVEGFMHILMPQRVIPLYTMVSFSRIPYSVVVKRWKRQTRWLSIGSGVLLGATLAGFTWTLLRNQQSLKQLFVSVLQKRTS